MQTSKMPKRSMTMFFTNLNLALMQAHLSYKNVDKIRALLTELLYTRVIWQTKRLTIASIITNVIPKEYLIYYLDILPAIQFLIDYQPFAQYLVYALVWQYLIDNPENTRLDNIDE